MIDIREVETILLATLDRAHHLGYMGYSKFDGLRSPLVSALSFHFWPFRLLWTQIIMRAPINLRPIFLVKKGINPESMALFARANLDMLSMNLDSPFRERAEICLNWLIENTSADKGKYHGTCWGYHHPWQSTGFYQPPGYPNCYITVIVGSALLQAFRALHIEDFLMTARSAVDFILNDLDVLYETAEEKCISYVPKMKADFAVVNINAQAAAFMAQVGVLTGENFLLEQARKLLTFVSRLQTSYGAWYYTTNPRQSLVAHDNYHTGMILDAYLDYENATGDKCFRRNYERGLEFYGKNLFLASGAPKWASDKIMPYDIHGSAQGILTFANAGDRGKALCIASWGIRNFYKGDGDFAYQKGRFLSKRFTLLHWCNGWMARGLAVFLSLVRRMDGMGGN
jgi:hypothetical protein